MFPDSDAWPWFVAGTIFILIGLVGPLAYDRLFIPWLRNDGPEAMREWFKKSSRRRITYERVSQNLDHEIGKATLIRAGIHFNAAGGRVAD